MTDLTQYSEKVRKDTGEYLFRHIVGYIRFGNVMENI
jgi:hypothetical protein